MPDESKLHTLPAGSLRPFDFPLSSLMPHTEVFELESKAAKATYVVWVTTPPGYNPSAKSAYPVIFAPDANLLVPTTVPSVEVATSLEMIFPVEPFVHVAVGYRPAEVRTSMEFLAIRARDLLPPGEPLPASVEAGMQAGVDAGVGEVAAMKSYLDNLRHPRADAFLTFLADELHPLIEARWRIDPARSAFFGYSYSGLFAAWIAMQRHPRFQIVCAGSPGIMVDNSKVFDLLRRERAAGADHSGRHLHLTLCESEITQPTLYQLLARQFSRLLEELGSAPLKGLKVTSHIVPYESHMSGFGSSWNSFLRTCFPGSLPKPFG
jgi:predicted alpha/beta superfamily hydrolase